VISSNKSIDSCQNRIHNSLLEKEGGTMGNGSLERYAPLETALNGTGFIVESIEQQDTKTVITVSQSGQDVEKPVFPGSGAAAPEQISEEPCGLSALHC
jgi:hypothetical protein